MVALEVVAGALFWVGSTLHHVANNLFNIPKYTRILASILKIAAAIMVFCILVPREADLKSLGFDDLKIFHYNTIENASTVIGLISMVLLIIGNIYYIYDIYTSKIVDYIGTICTLLSWAFFVVFAVLNTVQTSAYSTSYKWQLVVTIIIIICLIAWLLIEISINSKNKAGPPMARKPSNIAHGRISDWKDIANECAVKPEHNEFLNLQPENKNVVRNKVRNSRVYSNKGDDADIIPRYTSNVNEIGDISTNYFNTQSNRLLKKYSNVLNLEKNDKNDIGEHSTIPIDRIDAINNIVRDLIDAKKDSHTVSDRINDKAVELKADFSNRSNTASNEKVNEVFHQYVPNMPELIKTANNVANGRISLQSAITDSDNDKLFIVHHIPQTNAQRQAFENETKDPFVNTAIVIDVNEVTTNDLEPNNRKQKNTTFAENGEKLEIKKSTTLMRLKDRSMIAKSHFKLVSVITNSLCALSVGFYIGVLALDPYINP